MIRILASRRYAISKGPRSHIATRACKPGSPNIIKGVATHLTPIRRSHSNITIADSASPLSDVMLSFFTLHRQVATLGTVSLS